MKIAAFVIAHDCETWIRAAVLSLLAWDAIEFVVVAEGADGKSDGKTERGTSVDGTSSVLEHIAKRNRSRMTYLPIGSASKIALRNACLDRIDERGRFDWLLQWGDDEVWSMATVKPLLRLLTSRPDLEAVRFKHWWFWLDCRTLRDFNHRWNVRTQWNPPEVFPRRLVPHVLGRRYQSNQNTFDWLYPPREIALQVGGVYHMGYVGDPDLLVRRRMWHRRDFARIYGWPWDEQAARRSCIVEVTMRGPHRVGQFLRPWPRCWHLPREVVKAPLYGKTIQDWKWTSLLSEVADIPWQRHHLEVWPGKELAREIIPTWGRP